MRQVLVLVAFSLTLVYANDQSFAKSCDERCEDAKERCERKTKSIVKGFAGGMNCVVVQQRCTQEENAKAYRGGFPDLARCMQLGNDCTNENNDRMRQDFEATDDQCGAKYDSCLDRCNR